MLMFALLAAMSDPQPLMRAHAHNDYAHKRPLRDALEQGFCSIEADIYLVDGELRVGHDRKDLVAGRTLETLYLDPLAERVKLHRGQVYAKPAPVTLLVDVKTDGEAVYQALKSRLPRYRSMLSVFEDGKVRPGAVTIILSGDRAVETIRKESTRYVFVDGRMPDLQTASFDPKLMPLVSDSYGTLFKWNGRDTMPADERAKLTDAVKQAHAAGARIRFWGTPDRSEVWGTMYDAGVDLINTDNLAGLAGILRKKSDASQ